MDQLSWPVDFAADCVGDFAAGSERWANFDLSSTDDSLQNFQWFFDFRWLQVNGLKGNNTGKQSVSTYAICKQILYIHMNHRTSKEKISGKRLCLKYRSDIHSHVHIWNVVAIHPFESMKSSPWGSCQAQVQLPRPLGCLAPDWDCVRCSGPSEPVEANYPKFGTKNSCAENIWKPGEHKKEDNVRFWTNGTSISCQSIKWYIYLSWVIQ